MAEVEGQLRSSRPEVARPRIIYLSQLFDPEPTFKGLTFVKALAGAGYDVEVVTGFPNYPGGRLYPGYKVRLIQRDLMDGISVTRLPVYPSHGRSSLKRLLSYLSFFVSSAFYLLFVARRAQLVLVFYPSLTAGLAAVIAKLFRRTPVIVDIQDMWPDSLPATGMIRSGFLLGLIARLCNMTYRLSDHVIVLSKGFREVLIARGVAPERVSVIYNWAEEVSQAEPPASFAGQGTDRQFNVLFAGNMGTAQGLSTAVRAAEMLQTNGSQAAIHLMGTGVDVERLKQEAVQRGLQNIAFHPRVPLAQVDRHLRAADCLLVHLVRDPLFKITIPSKTQAYLYAGRPIIMAVEGEAADMVREANAGIIVPPEDPNALANAIENMARLSPDEREKMGADGRVYYEKELSFAVNSSKILKLMEKTCLQTSRDNV